MPTAASTALFVELMRARLTDWLTLADERLRPAGRRLYFMLGNDDPAELADLLDGAPWGVHDEGRVVMLDDDHEMISWGYSNITPWHSHREMTEEELGGDAPRAWRRSSRRRDRAIFNFHVPPYGSGLDDAPLARRGPDRADRRRPGQASPRRAARPSVTS